MSPRPVALVFPLALGAACSGTPPAKVAPAPVAPSAEPTVPPTPAPSTTVETAPSDAPAPVAPPEPPAIPAACRVSADHAFDLAAALGGNDCTLAEDPNRARPVLPAAIDARVEPANATVARGGWVVLHVHLRNASEASVDLVIEREQSFADVFESGFNIGHGDLGGLGTARARPKPMKPKKPPPPPPNEKTTPGFSVSGVVDAKNRDTTMPTGAYGMLGLLGTRNPEQARFVLEPHAEVVAAVVWAAKGYDPDKNYFGQPRGGKTKSGAAEGMMLPSPEALKPGQYRLGVELPVLGGEGTRLSLPVKLRVTK